jgi:ABC-2 type transport system permease protein
MDKMNMTVKTLNTTTKSSIPKDCDILFINAPQSDFSASEATMIKDYLSAGGKAIITLNYVAEDFPNFQSILKNYGVGLVKGFVIEQDSNMHASKYVNYLFPNIESNDITKQVNNNSIPVFMPNSTGLEILDAKRSSLKIDPLLTTSDSAFSKINISSSTSEKEDGDIDGPFNLGLAVTDTYNNVTSKLVIYSSAYTFSEDTAKYGNSDLLSGTVGFLSGNTKLVTIPTKSLSAAQVYMTQKVAAILTILVIVIIPVIILSVGGVICYKRRKR